MLNIVFVKVDLGKLTVKISTLNKENSINSKITKKIAKNKTHFLSKK